MNIDPVVIVSYARTPIGGFLGALKGFSATELGACAIRATVERAAFDPGLIERAYIGNVLAAGLGQAPARQAVLGAGLGQGVACTTVSKVCGSGMQAVMAGYDSIAAGSAQVVLAGGMESMSNAPYLLQRARAGLRFGHTQLTDHMLADGLEDAYSNGTSMGVFAEATVARYGFSREEQDDYARLSLRRARAAAEGTAFAEEIVSLAVGDLQVSRDEQPGKADEAKIARLKPAFKVGGSVTAANSSSISDGAAALLLMRQSRAEALGLTPIAAIRGQASFAHEPQWFSTAPIHAIGHLLGRVGWSVADVDLFEINEAFAVVVLAAIRELELDVERVNVNGGACALGHPIGASGARIIVTLLAALAERGLQRGVASLCIGGGEATALAVEML